MIFIFILIFISLCIIISCWLSEEDYGILATTVCVAVIMAICGVMSLASYLGYVSMRASYDTTISQYRQAVTMYEDIAELDVEKASFTDFKYKGYQENIAKFVYDLRREVVEYNRRLIGKRTLKKGIIFNWLITAPDEDMKIINLKD